MAGLQQDNQTGLRMRRYMTSVYLGLVFSDNVHVSERYYKDFLKFNTVTQLYRFFLNRITPGWLRYLRSRWRCSIGAAITEETLPVLSMFVFSSFRISVSSLLYCQF